MARVSSAHPRRPLRVRGAATAASQPPARLLHPLLVVLATMAATRGVHGRGVPTIQQINWQNRIGAIIHFDPSTYVGAFALCMFAIEHPRDQVLGAPRREQRAKVSALASFSTVWHRY